MENINLSNGWTLGRRGGGETSCKYKIAKHFLPAKCVDTGGILIWPLENNLQICMSENEIPQCAVGSTRTIVHTMQKVKIEGI